MFVCVCVCVCVCACVVCMRWLKGGMTGFMWEYRMGPCIGDPKPLAGGKRMLAGGL